MYVQNVLYTLLTKYGPDSRTYSDSVDKVHVGLDGQRGVLHLHQLGEDHRQLHHLAEVDVNVIDPVR